MTAEFAAGGYIRGPIDGESTSARLRRVEQERDEAEAANDALRAELAGCYRELAAEREARDETDRRLALRFSEMQVLKAERDEALSAFSLAEELRLKATTELASARTELAHLRDHQEIRARVVREKSAENARLRGQLVDVRAAAAEQVRAARQAVGDPEWAVGDPGWIVARDGGRYCERCEQEIQRGQAYEHQPGTGGLLAHVRCPHPPEEKSMPTTFDNSPAADPMITAATEAIWPHLPSEVQDTCYEPAAITPWATAAAAAALRVMADEIDRGPTFAVRPSDLAALVRERADRIGGGEGGNVTAEVTP